MTRWLAVSAGLWLLGSSGAQAQLKGLGAPEIAEVAKNRTLDLRIPPEAGYSNNVHVAPNMIVHQDFGEKAALGLGLANMYEKRKSGGDQTVRSRKPAVTFIMKF